MTDPDADIAGRLASVRARIDAAAHAAGRNAADVTLIAVSKTRSAAAVDAVLAAGCDEVGENYLQEALDKQSATTGHATWHFIGALQSNKTRAVAEHFDWVHTVDRLKIARRLADQRPEHLAPLQLCLEVNIDDEASKAGLTPADALTLATQIAAMPRLQLRGLMAIPAPRNETDDKRVPFARLAALLEELRDGLAAAGHDVSAVNVLSMGMSDDLEAAITEGATHVRVGTAIFGPRPAKPTAADLDHKHTASPES